MELCAFTLRALSLFVFTLRRDIRFQIRHPIEQTDSNVTVEETLTVLSHRHCYCLPLATVMLPTLGSCEDSACVQSSSHQDMDRLFRCSIHCDLNLCLFHLNAHNVRYQEEKKQSSLLMSELRESLITYQAMFEQRIQSSRELVRQASSLLLHNTSSVVPIDHIRPVMARIQQAITMFQEETSNGHSSVGKNSCDLLEAIKDESILVKADATRKHHVLGSVDNTQHELGQQVTVRLQRVNCLGE